MIDVGDKAPAFDMTAAGEGAASAKALKGQPFVLYFYTRDDTPGCTKEAIAFTTLKPEFDALGVAIVGVSKDSIAKHEKFIGKHDLAITLGSDESGVVCAAYGVWVEKKNYGRTYMGIERSTFLVDARGAVRQVWRKVRVKDHAEAVLEAARGL
jgi:peroxiredoxin Q/BCP